jgi:hypothetical protein
VRGTLYGYVGDNPVNYVDPLGLETSVLDPSPITNPRIQLGIVVGIVIITWPIIRTLPWLPPTANYEPHEPTKEDLARIARCELIHALASARCSQMPGCTAAERLLRRLCYEKATQDLGDCLAGRNGY